MAPEPIEPPVAPPVVAVVVAADPGAWFDETLDALGAQDYPNLSVLVVDVASNPGLADRVAAALPSAFVHRLDRRVPYGVAANEALTVVEGAGHLLLCHDDVAPAPDAVRAMVEEAFRSNAGVVTPKLVDWHDPTRLLAVGAGADRFGVAHPLVEPGELDQEQHDGVRDVFVAPAGASLVRADLFAAVGGYDADVAEWGDDLDLSWRVQVAGARVVTAPLARVRHLEATVAGLRSRSGSRRSVEAARLARERHRLRTALTCYGPLRLVLMVPLLAVHAVVEAVGLAVGGRAGEAGAPLRALTAALRGGGGLLGARRRVQRSRQTPDRDLARLQSSGSARLRAWVRTRLDEGPGRGLALADPEAAALALTGADIDPAVTGGLPGATVPDADGSAAAATVVGGPGSWRLTAVAVVVITALVAVGSRSLLGGHLPTVGTLPAGDGSVGQWWAQWWSTWRSGWLGATGPGAPGLGLLALLASVVGRSAATHLAVLGPLLLGPIGAARAARPWGSPRARLAAAVVYATAAVPYDALAAGRWGGLAAYAAAPWVVGGVGSLGGGVPNPARPWRSVRGRVVTLAAGVALAGAVAPSFVLVAVAVGVGTGLGALAVGERSSASRALAVAVAAAFGAALLLSPWWPSLLGARASLFGAPAGPGTAAGLGRLLELRTGPVGGVAGLGLLVAAALVLVVGRGWRLAWGARAWGVALVCAGLAWAGSRGWVPAPAPEVLLAPAAAAWAAAVGLGVVAFEMDLPGYRLGWRQAAAALAAVAAAVAAVPVVVGAADGRWHLPSQGTTSALALADDSRGDYRVLWVGAPATLPLPGASLRPGVAFATTWDGGPVTTDEFADAASGSAALADDLRLVAERRTTTAGHLLAAAGVRYVVVPSAVGATSGPPAAAASTSPPGDLLQGLARQTDLQAVAAAPGVSEYVDTAWVPARSALPAGQALPARPGDVALGQLDIGGARPVLRGGPGGARGRVEGPSSLFVAASPAGFTLHAAGRSTRATPALGIASQVPVPAGAGEVRLEPPGSLGERLGQLGELALVALAAAAVVVDRRRRRLAPEVADPAWFSRAVDGRRDRRPPASPARPVGTVFGDDDDEVWAGA